MEFGSHGNLSWFLSTNRFDRSDLAQSLGARCPLLVLDNETALALGESPVQLRERARYE